MDLGFKKAGFNIVYANDFDSDAQAVYSMNIGEIDRVKESLFNIINLFASVRENHCGYGILEVFPA